MNLEKALSKEALKIREKEDTEIGIIATNRLIADKGAEDLQMIRDLGMSSSITIRKDKMGKKLHLAALQEKHKNVYTIEEIKAVALKYGLRFLRSENYKGEVDPELPAKIREFAQEDGIDLNSAKLGYNFFILAPHEAFELVDRIKPQPIDPCIFYHLGGGNYRLVFQWGSDFTMLRRFIGWRNESSFNFLTSLFAVYFLILSTFFTLFLPDVLFTVYVLSAIASLIIAWSRVAYLIGEYKWRSHNVVWDTNEKNAEL